MGRQKCLGIVTDTNLPLVCELKFVRYRIKALSYFVTPVDEFRKVWAKVREGSSYRQKIKGLGKYIIFIIIIFDICKIKQNTIMIN